MPRLSPGARVREGLPDAARDDAEARLLIQRIRRGEPQLAAVIYERYFDVLYGYLRSTLGNSADAEDVTQQVFEAMFEALAGDALWRIRSMRQWLFAVARNRAIDHRRKHDRVEVRAPEEMSECHGESSRHRQGTGWVFDDAALGRAVRRLPQRQREVVLLRYVGDFDLAEIAAIIGVSEGSVKEAHHRALGSLRARFRPDFARYPKSS